VSVVYVACTKERLDLAREAMRRVKEAGHELAFDWTEAIQREDQMGDEELSLRAATAIQHVVSAGYLVLITAEEMRSVGSIVEMGALLGSGGHVIVVEEHGSFDHFFCRHPRVEKVATLDEAIARLEDLTDW
jgi:hypothetical protein